MDASTEIWEDREGNALRVTIVREYPENREICPKCHGSVKTVVGIADGGEQFHRLECLMCSWASSASPGPKANPGGWSLEM